MSVIRAWRSISGTGGKSVLALLVLLLLLLLPPAAFISSILAPLAKTTSLNLFGVIGIMAGATFWLVEKMKFSLRTVCIVLICVFIMGFINRSNAINLKGYLYTQAAFETANRVLARIEKMPEFQKKPKIAFVGRLPNVFETPYTGPPFNELGRGFWGGLTGFADPRTKRSDKIMNLYKIHGLNLSPLRLNVVDCEVAEEAALDMPIWPDSGSIRAVDDLIVVNFGDRVPVKGITVEELGDGRMWFSVKVSAFPERWMYAWYVFNDSGERIHVQWYNHSNSNVLDYTFKKSGAYIVKSFIKGTGTEKDASTRRAKSMNVIVSK